MKKNPVSTAVLIICFALPIVFLIIYNLIVQNNIKFWEVSAIQLLQIAAAVFVSYALVQKKNDQKIKAELMDKLYQRVLASFLSYCEEVEVYIKLLSELGSDKSFDKRGRVLQLQTSVSNY